jgi:hypothetical protein
MLLGMIRLWTNSTSVYGVDSTGIDRLIAVVGSAQPLFDKVILTQAEPQQTNAFYL